MSDALQELAARVVAWGDAKGILAKSDPVSQALKMLSEFGELADAVAKGDQAGIEDGIGDTAVTVILLAKLGGVDPSVLCECVNIEECCGGPLECSDADSKEFMCLLSGQIAAIAQSSVFVSGVSPGALARVLCGLGLLAARHRSTLVSCLRGALEIIESRQGKMVNGVFVKEYADAQG